MNAQFHRFSELFGQLGLAADVASIQSFLITHSPLALHIRLEDAHFWTAAQANLLREEIMIDADWAEVVDRLNTALREPGVKR